MRRRPPIIFAALLVMSFAELAAQTGGSASLDDEVMLQPQPAYWSKIDAEETYCSELYRLLKNVTKPDPSLVVTHFPEIYSGVRFMEPLKEALVKLGLEDNLCPPPSPMVSRGVPFYFRPFKLGSKAKHEMSVGGGDEFSHIYVLTDGSDRVVGIHLVCLAPKSTHQPNTDFFYFDFPLSKRRSSTVTRVRWEVEDAEDNLVLKAWHINIRDGGRCQELSEWYLPKRVANFIRYVLDVKLGVVSPPSAQESSSVAAQMDGSAVRRELGAGMVVVDGGRFPDTSPWWGGWEVETFMLGRYETTLSEWQEVKSWAVANGYDLADSGRASGKDHPVHSVNWYEIAKWCNARSEMEGLQPVYLVAGEPFRTGSFGKEGSSAVWADPEANGYRLPTEAEWQWAERGGTLDNGHQFAGSDNIDEVAWWSGNSRTTEAGLRGKRGTWPVGRKKPNELGLFDTKGNIAEVCSGVRRHGPPLVARGGSFNSSMDFTYYVWGPHDLSGGDEGGFRVARNGPKPR